MKGVRFSLIFFIGFLLVISLVNAVQINTQNLAGDLCPRETGSFSHVIRNDGNSVKQYNINLRGSASSWATSVPSGVILEPGEEKIIYTYVTPSQSAEPGDYSLIIDVTSGAETASNTHNVKVKSCYGVSLIPTSNKLDTCPAKPVRFVVRVVNTGEYTETYKFSLSGELSSKTSLSDNIALLGKGESKELYLFVNSPKEDGSYSLSLIVETDSGRVRGSLPLFLDVKPCYNFGFEVKANNTYNVCERSLIIVPLTLKNDGTTINTFKINVDGPSWARLENDQYTLHSSEVRNFNLVMAPGYNTHGDYGIRVTVTPEKGDLKSVSDFGVTVRKCFSVDLEFEDEEVSACKGAKNEYDITVTNDGEIKKLFRLTLDGPNWLTIKPESSTNVGPGERANLTLVANPTPDAREGRYTIKLDARTTDETAVVANDQDELKLELKKPDDCYRSTLSSDYSDIVVYFDSSVTIPVEVTNNGLRDAEFSLFLSGNSGKFTRLNPSVVNLKTGKSEIVYLYIAPGPDVELGKYDARVILNLKDGPLLTSKEFNIEITNIEGRATQNLEANVSVNETVSNVSIGNISWGNFKSKIYEYKKWVLGVILALIIIIILLIIFRKQIANFYTENDETEITIEREEVHDTEKAIGEPKTKRGRKKKTSNDLDDIKKGV